MDATYYTISTSEPITYFWEYLGDTDTAEILSRSTQHVAPFVIREIGASRVHKAPDGGLVVKCHGGPFQYRIPKESIPDLEISVRTLCKGPDLLASLQG